MRRMARNIAVLVAACAVALTACSTADTSSGSSSKGSRTLTIWVPSLMTSETRAFPKRFSTAESNVTVNVVTLPNPFEQNVLTKWRAGDRPDVLYFHGIGNWLAQLNPSQTLTDLSDMAFVKKTQPGILDNSTRFQGKVYGAVVDYPGIDGGLYNKEVFSQLGITPPKTFAELETVCQKIKSSGKGVIPIDMAGGDQWPLQILPFILFNDGIKADPQLMQKVNTNQAHFTDPQFTVGFEGLKDLHTKGCFNSDASTSKYETSIKRLIEGKAAMIFNLSVASGIMVDTFGADAVDKKIGFFPMSYRTDVTSWQLTGQSIYVPNRSDKAQVDLAKRYVDWITGPAYQDYVNLTKQYPIIQGATAPDGIVEPLKEAKAAFEANSVPQ
jgi:raffinose/stachyose/melibiose transport system substrate-binding protein